MRALSSWTHSVMVVVVLTVVAELVVLLVIVSDVPEVSVDEVGVADAVTVDSEAVVCVVVSVEVVLPAQKPHEKSQRWAPKQVGQ